MLLLLNLFMCAWRTKIDIENFIAFYIEIVFSHQRNYFRNLRENILIQQSAKYMWNSHLFYFTPHNYVVTMLWNGGPRNCASSVGRGKRFVENDSRVRLASYSRGTVGCFPRVWSSRAMTLTINLHLMSRLRINSAVLPPVPIVSSWLAQR